MHVASPGPAGSVRTRSRSRPPQPSLAGIQPASPPLSHAQPTRTPISTGPVAIPGRCGRSREVKPIRSSSSSAGWDVRSLASRSSVSGSWERSPRLSRVRIMSVDSTQATSTSSRAEAVDLALDKILEAEVLRQLWPIMGRLPVEHEEHAGQDEGSSAYLRSNTDSPLARVLYTRSRLPQLDADSRKLWKALYAFRPVVSDYAEGYVPIASASVAVRSGLRQLYKGASTRQRGPPRCHWHPRLPICGLGSKARRSPRQRSPRLQPVGPVAASLGAGLMVRRCIPLSQAVVGQLFAGGSRRPASAVGRALRS